MLSTNDYTGRLTTNKTMKKKGYSGGHFGFAEKTRFYCPHCGKVFSYRYMWCKLTENIGDISKIMGMLKISYQHIRKVLNRYRDLEFSITGTRANDTWESVAARAQYYNPTEMFYDLRKRGRVSWDRMPGYLGIKSTPENIKIIKRTGTMLLKRISKKGTGKKGNRTKYVLPAVPCTFRKRRKPQEGDKERLKEIIDMLKVDPEGIITIDG
jgi:hypothetical protein